MVAPRVPGFALTDGLLSFAVQKHGEWQTAAKMMEHLERDVYLACSHTVRDEAMLFYRMVKQRFRAGNGWRKLSRITLEMRRNASLAEGLGSSFTGEKPLIRTGFMRRSVNLQKTGPGAWFVGVHRTAGERAVNIADVHENGPKVIPITDKMRKYFMYLFMKGVLEKPWPPLTKKFIIIKRRSFLGDTFKEWFSGSGDRVEKLFQHYFQLAAEGKIRSLRNEGAPEGGE